MTVENQFGENDFVLREGWSFVTETGEYQSGSDLEQRAYDFAIEKHGDQKRKDGSLHTDHVVAVASILRDVMRIEDEKILAAALLHDVVEDTDASDEEVEEIFGSEVMKMVKGVTELKGTGKPKRQEDMATTQKVVRESGLDPRVALVKLADRAHNMLTLESMPEDKRIAKAKETFEVYVPLAESLGLWEFKRKLEDLAVSYLFPEKMETARKYINSDPRLTEDFLYYRKSELDAILVGAGMEGQVEWQVMGYWEAVRKKEQLGVRDFSQVQLVSFRVKVADEMGCRMASQYLRVQMGLVVDTSRADDYITNPAYNGYMAMHESLETDKGVVEVAFVTEEMEEFNRWGVVGEVKRGGDVKRYDLKLIFDGEGKVMKFLPKEATGVDLLVSIDVDLLEMVEGMLVNGKRMPLSVMIPNAATVEMVMRTEINGLDFDLMDYAMLPETREKLDRYMNDVLENEDVVKGKEMLSRWMKGKGFDDLNDLLWMGEKIEMRNVLMSLGVSLIKELYLEIGLGNRAVEEVIRVFDKAKLEGLTVPLMKLRLSGVNSPGILDKVTTWIMQQGGDIKILKSMAGDRYEMEMVVVIGDEGKKEVERLLEGGSENWFEYMEMV